MFLRFRFFVLSCVIFCSCVMLCIVYCCDCFVVCCGFIMLSWLYWCRVWGCILFSLVVIVIVKSGLLTFMGCFSVCCVRVICYVDFCWVWWL